MDNKNKVGKILFTVYKQIQKLCMYSPYAAIASICSATLSKLDIS